MNTKFDPYERIKPKSWYNRLVEYLIPNFLNPKTQDQGSALSSQPIVQLSLDTQKKHPGRIRGETRTLGKESPDSFLESIPLPQFASISNESSKRPLSEEIGEQQVKRTRVIPFSRETRSHSHYIQRTVPISSINNRPSSMNISKYTSSPVVCTFTPSVVDKKISSQRHITPSRKPINNSRIFQNISKTKYKPPQRTSFLSTSRGYSAVFDEEEDEVTEVEQKNMEYSRKDIVKPPPSIKDTPLRISGNSGKSVFQFTSPGNKKPSIFSGIVQPETKSPVREETLPFNIPPPLTGFLEDKQPVVEKKGNNISHPPKEKFNLVKPAPSENPQNLSLKPVFSFGSVVDKPLPAVVSKSSFNVTPDSTPFKLTKNTSPKSVTFSFDTKGEDKEVKSSSLSKSGDFDFGTSKNVDNDAKSFSFSFTGARNNSTPVPTFSFGTSTSSSFSFSADNKSGTSVADSLQNSEKITGTVENKDSRNVSKSTEKPEHSEIPSFSFGVNKFQSITSVKPLATVGGLDSNNSFSFGEKSKTVGKTEIETSAAKPASSGFSFAPPSQTKETAPALEEKKTNNDQANPPLFTFGASSFKNVSEIKPEGSFKPFVPSELSVTGTSAPKEPVLCQENKSSETSSQNVKESSLLSESVTSEVGSSDKPATTAFATSTFAPGFGGSDKTSITDPKTATASPFGIKSAFGSNEPKFSFPSATGPSAFSSAAFSFGSQTSSKVNENSKSAFGSQSESTVPSFSFGTNSSLTSAFGDPSKAVNFSNSDNAPSFSSFSAESKKSTSVDGSTPQTKVGSFNFGASAFSSTNSVLGTNSLQNSQEKPLFNNTSSDSFAPVAESSTTTFSFGASSVVSSTTSKPEEKGSPIVTPFVQFGAIPSQTSLDVKKTEIKSSTSFVPSFGASAPQTASVSQKTEDSKTASTIFTPSFGATVPQINSISQKTEENKTGTTTFTPSFGTIPQITSEIKKVEDTKTNTPSFSFGVSFSQAAPESKKIEETKNNITSFAPSFAVDAAKSAAQFPVVAPSTVGDTAFGSSFGTAVEGKNSVQPATFSLNANISNNPPSIPSFSFGQSNAKTEVQPFGASNAAPVPSFTFGTSGNTNINQAPSMMSKFPSDHDMDMSSTPPRQDSQANLAPSFSVPQASTFTFGSFSGGNSSTNTQVPQSSSFTFGSTNASSFAAQPNFNFGSGTANPVNNTVPTQESFNFGTGGATNPSDGGLFKFGASGNDVGGFSVGSSSTSQRKIAQPKARRGRR